MAVLWLSTLAGAAVPVFLEPEATVLWMVEEPGGINFGWAVADIPDVDGDGITDVITGDPFATGYAGMTAVLSGADGTELFRAAGAAGGLESYGVSSVGDLDADGVSDVLSGAPGLDHVSVYSGATGAVLAPFVGPAGTFFGAAVGSAGDVDGDGVDDVVVGATSASASFPAAGAVFVMSGATRAELWHLDGEAAGDAMGAGTGFLGDVTGDGVPDVAVGAQGNGGQVYVLSGVDGAVIHRLSDPQGGGNLGSFFVSGVGDIDADGVPDVFGGDYGHPANGPSTGRAYVWSGATGANLLTITGSGPGEGLGTGRYAGDVDADGVPDLAIGSWISSIGGPYAGQVNVFSGSDGSVLRTVTSQVPGETFGFDTIGLGDVDGDSEIDLLVSGASLSRVYLVGTAPDPKPTADTGTPPDDTGDDTGPDDTGPEDTGPDDTGAPPDDTDDDSSDDTGTPPDDDDDGGCGCATPAGPALWLTAPLIAGFLRRRSA